MKLWRIAEHKRNNADWIGAFKTAGTSQVLRAFFYNIRKIHAKQGRCWGGTEDWKNQWHHDSKSADWRVCLVSFFIPLLIQRKDMKRTQFMQVWSMGIKGIQNFIWNRLYKKILHRNFFNNYIKVVEKC